MMYVSNSLKKKSFDSHRRLVRQGYDMKFTNSGMQGTVSCLTRVSPAEGFAVIQQAYRILLPMTINHPFVAVLQAKRFRDAKAQLGRLQDGLEKIKVLKQYRVDQMRGEMYEKVRHLMGRHGVGAQQFVSSGIGETK